MRRWLYILLALTWATLPGVATAKSYSVSRVHVDARATRDGLIVIEEQLTYRFDGSFSFAFRDIPVKSGESISDIVVSEDGVRYRQESGKDPGTFSTSRGDLGLRVTWYYRARDEARTFTLRYVVTGALKRYRDVAELYFQFIGDGWDRSIGDATVQVEAPEGLSSSDVRAWAHGPLHGTVEILAGGDVRMNVSPLPPRTFWEGRVLYPTEIFDGMPILQEDARARIMEEERGWAEEANRQRAAQQLRLEEESAQRARQREMAGRLRPVSILLGLAGIGVWILLYRRHGRAHDVNSRSAPGEIPSDHPPAVVAYLVQRHSVGGSAIVATLLDLADRGVLEIKETVEEKRSWFGRRKQTDYSFSRTESPLEDLVSFEHDLLDFMFNVAGTGRDFTMSGLKKAASKQRRRFRKWFTAWIKDVKAYAQTFEFYEPYPVGPMVLNAVMGVVVALIGIVFMLTTHSATGAIALILGLVQAGLTATLSRHTVEGRRLALAWRDFRAHLKRTAKGLGPVNLSSREWGRYLGAAIIFGMHKKLLPQLRIVDDAGTAGIYPVWYHGVSDSSPGDMAALADGFSSMVSSVSGTMSSASGTGGGASGGGGGGSGGGGGGAG